MDATARSFEVTQGGDGTQEILNERLSTLMDHLIHTKGHYLHGWEIDFIKNTGRDRAKRNANGFDFVIASEPATIICSIYNRLSLECRL